MRLKRRDGGAVRQPAATTKITPEWVCPECDYFEEAEEEEPEVPERARSARADSQQDFLAEGILELLELERRFALVA